MSIDILYMIIFGCIFIIGLLIIIGIKTDIKNNNSPILTVNAKVVAKRAEVSHYTRRNNNNTAMNYYRTSSTAYYVCFEVDCGDRLELRVWEDEYAVLVEGDRGRLIFQGTRFNGFERN